MMHALKKRVLTASASVMVILLILSVASIALAWFDREADGYLHGAPSNGRLGYTHNSTHAYASEIDVTQRDDVMRIIPEAPFSIFVTKDGEHTRAYIEADFTNPTARQAYAQWNATKVSSVLLNASWPAPVKVTFRAPLSITDAQKLVDAANLILNQVIFVGRDRHNQPYSGGVFIDKIDSKISLGVLEAIWAERGIGLDGVMVVEGSLDGPEALAWLLKSPEVYLVDITASWVPQQLNIADLQGIVVPSPYWWLYMEWLNQHSK